MPERVDEPPPPPPLLPPVSCTKEELVLQVAVSPAFTIQQSHARLKIWESRIAEHGGLLLRPAAGAARAASKAGATGAPTHCLVGDEPNAAAAAAAVASNTGQCQIVHYSWLEASLRKKQRLCEADFAPDALAQAAAASDSANQPAGQQRRAAGAAGGRASTAGTAAAAGLFQAAVAKASAASSSAAAAAAPPPLRQLAIRSSKLMAVDVQQLLLHLLAGRPRPHWLSIHGRPSSVVLVELPGLDQQALRWEQPPALQQLQAAAKQRVEVQAVSAAEVPTQTIAALMSVPNPHGRGGSSKKRKQPEQSSSPYPTEAAARTAAAAGAAAIAAGAAGAAGAGGPEPTTREPPSAAQLAFPLQFYCCTPRHMRQLSYPAGCAEAAAAAAAGGGAGESSGGAGISGVAVPQLPPGWVSTTLQGVLSQGAGCTEHAAHQPLVAVDCEMVITAAGYELARVTLVDGQGRSLLDELVLPQNPVLDHNTKYSGITAEMLAGCHTTLPDAQRMVLKHVGPHTLLVGHTLQNDLKVLQMVHGRCIDSAAIYPSARGLPALPSLKLLAQRLLGRQIQEGAHDSHTDAVCTLEVVQRKLRHGPTFATAKEGHTHLFELLASQGRRLALVAPREALMLHAVPAAQVVPSSSDAQGVEAALSLLGSEIAGQASAEQQQQQQQQQQGQQQQQQVTRAGAAGGEQGPTELQVSQRQRDSSQDQRQRPPDLLYLQLADLWGHLEDGALRLAAQSTPVNLTAAVAAAQQGGEAKRLLQQADTLLARLTACLPPNTLLLVLSGQGNNALTRVLHGEGSRRKEGVEGQNRRREAAKASVPVQQLAQRAQQGVLLVAWRGAAGT